MYSDTSPYKASEYSLEKVKNGVGAMCTYCMLRILREINLILKTIAKLFFSTTTLLLAMPLQDVFLLPHIP